MSFEVFSKDCERHPHSVYPVYQILRDLFIKQKYHEVEIVAGGQWHVDRFLLLASRQNIPLVLYFPAHIDENLDLDRLHQIGHEMTKLNVKLCLAVVSPETIIYQMVATSLL